MCRVSQGHFTAAVTWGWQRAARFPGMSILRAATGLSSGVRAAAFHQNPVSGSNTCPMASSVGQGLWHCILLQMPPASQEILHELPVD